MPPNAGRPTPQPPQRTATFSSLFRAVTGGNKEKSPEVETKEVFIPRYELEWDSLKEWLDTRFAQYKCTFTERFNVVRFDLRYVEAHIADERPVRGQVCRLLARRLNRGKFFVIPEVFFERAPEG